MGNQIFRNGFNLGLPEAEELDREIRRLQRKRDQIISDHLSGVTRTQFGGMEIVSDPAVEPGTIELRDGCGRIVGKITNVGAG